MVVRDIRGSVGCVGKLVTRRQSAAERGLEEVVLRLLRRKSWWRILVDSGRLPQVEKGWTKAKGWRRPTKQEAALRRRSTEAAFVHKNKFGVLEVDSGDLSVYAVEASAQVHELDVAQVSTEITIDSAAEESVCQQKWAESFGLQTVDRPLKLVNASGGRIEHFGKGAVSFNPENCDGRTIEAKFEVSNVRKPLMAVARVVDAGNVVQFGPRPEDNFIMHVGSNDKVYLRRKGNSFVLKAELTEARF